MAAHGTRTRRRIVLVTLPDDRGGRIFDTAPESGNRDLCRDPLARLRDLLAASGVDLSTCDGPSDLRNADLVVFHVPSRAILAECLALGLGPRTALLAWEPPVVSSASTPESLRRQLRLFGRILTWDTALSREDGFLELSYPHALGPVDPSPLPFSDRGLLVNISADKRSSHPLELYSRRAEIVRGFEALEPGFELWGPGWNPAAHPSWKGLASSKREVYHRFRFALCLENMRSVPGYSTEKLFDVLQWGAVPVYQGDPSLESLLPREAWVDASAFPSPAALHAELLSWTEERHARALEHGRNFLASPAADRWRPEFLSKQFLACLELAGTAPRHPRPSAPDLAILAAAWLRSLPGRRRVP